MCIFLVSRQHVVRIHKVQLGILDVSLRSTAMGGKGSDRVEKTVYNFVWDGCVNIHEVDGKSERFVFAHRVLFHFTSTHTTLKELGRRVRDMVQLLRNFFFTKHACVNVARVATHA